MTPEEIERLSRACAGAGIAEIELTENGFSLRVRISQIRPLGASQDADAPRQTPPAAFNGVRAPGVGVFRAVHPITSRASAEPGQAVVNGQTVAFLQIGPCLKAVTAPADGVLGAALAEDGEVVGYGTPLYPLS